MSNTKKIHRYHIHQG